MHGHKSLKLAEFRFHLNNTNFILFTIYRSTAIHSEANINLGTIRGEAVSAVSTKFLLFCAKLSCWFAATCHRNLPHITRDLILHLRNFTQIRAVVCRCVCLCLAFLSAFAKLRTLFVSFIMSAFPSVRMEQLGSHRADFNEISYLSTFRKSGERIYVWLKSDKTNGTVQEDPYTFVIISLSVLPRKINISDKV